MVLRRLVSKLAASIADQGVASSTNFVLNILLVRWLLTREYGAYSVSWSILLMLAGFHNALILEPMTVVGPADYARKLPAYFQTTARLNWYVVLPLSMVGIGIGLAYHDALATPAVFVISLCLPGYLLMQVARRKQYVRNEPARALILSVFYSVMVFAFIAVCKVTGRLSAITGAAAFGFAWVVGLSALQGGGEAVSIGEVARKHWHYGKWLFLSAILAMGALDMQTVLLSALVDLKAAGALRALMNFVLPLTQLMTVLGIYALPRFAGRAANWGKEKLLRKGIFFPLGMLVVMILYLGMLQLFAPQVERVVYGGKMAAYLAWMPLLSASVMVAGVGSAFSVLLRAVQNSQHQFVAGVAGTVVGVAGALLMLRRMGVAGALWAMLGANTTTTFITIGFYIWFLRRSHENSNASSI